MTMSESRPAPVILLGEDDALCGEVLCGLLRRLGCSPRWVRDGRELWALWQRRHHALVLLDQDLPGLSGLQLLQLRAAHPAAAGGAPVVMLSGSGAGEFGAQARGAGAAEVLVKPVWEAQLRGVLERHLAPLGMKAAHPPLAAGPRPVVPPPLR